jgi:hypothetical protein
MNTNEYIYIIMLVKIACYQVTIETEMFVMVLKIVSYYNIGS